MANGTASIGGRRPVTGPEIRPGPGQDTGVRFRGGNKNVWSRILARLKPARTATPYPRFSLRLPARKHLFTNNLMEVRDCVFGDTAARQGTSSLNRCFGQSGKSARLKTNLRLDLGAGSQLSGFSVSANPSSSELDTDKPVVLFLSGSAGSAEQYGPELAKHFAEHEGVNFVALNYRGFGRSTNVAPTEKTITEDGFSMMNHLLEQGFRPENIIVHGYSMGASVAARLQARVEAAGHRLAGAVYDRPMSSATGAAKAEAEADHPNPQGFREKAFVFIKKNFFAFGTKITVGSMSARRTLERLQEANPDGLRSPTFVTYDDETLSARSRRMGEHLGVPTLATKAGHKDHLGAIENVFSRPEMQAMYRGADTVENDSREQSIRQQGETVDDSRPAQPAPEQEPVAPLFEPGEELLKDIDKQLGTNLQD